MSCGFVELRGISRKVEKSYVHCIFQLIPVLNNSLVAGLGVIFVEK